MATNNALMKKLAITATLTSSVLTIPTAASAHFSDSSLKKGMHDDEVKTLQYVLKEAGYYKLSKPSGYFGASTVKAVKQYQQDKQLKVDGVVGPKTKTSLNKDMENNWDLMRQGDKGHGVEGVQDDLKDLGYYKGNLDGIFGPLTRLSVLHFQKSNELKMDGIVGPKTYYALHDDPVAAEEAKATRKKSTEKRPVTTTNKKTTKKTVSRGKSSNTVKELFVSATGYTANCAGCSGITATGINLKNNPGAKVVAVDPDVIPLGTKLYVDGYGYAVAGDTGGAINGKRIDLFFPDRSDALQWGRRTVRVKVLD
ncbi:3D (Asp-Asp-Asp) domain-containing protein [Scopulibacillus darangshiensis]|uniref:3D (Asp-Asp-Asp) domain-containing protein n=1 Tax=Scopulibacillus darangshiensis TaxID=442528 RepID=A0A4R2NQX7_9BACL|nr:peptidoglycan-binding protein [Scopulibacillus darangshiensis]TCP23788.1 3D (Asp-Asp-Asp) domain-containing protein [Scopulibacillus darangshiensis]